MTKSELTIVIPTYNEGDIIESALKCVSEALGELRKVTEIIIADDGNDDLPVVVERCGLLFGFVDVKVMRNKSRLGKGESIRKAFMVSQGDIIGFIDIDFSVAPSFIHDAVREIKNGSDICIASRVGNRFKSDGSLTTSIFGTLFGFINRSLLFNGNKSFSDTQCGFKFFKKEVALDLYRDLIATDGLTDLEVLIKAVKHGYKVSELKVPRFNDRVGKRKISSIFIPETISLCQIFCKYKLGLNLFVRNTDN